VKKSSTNNQLPSLTLKKETIAQLSLEALKDVVAGNNSTRRSQCVTLCF
jgi:hypothetical protein